MVFDDAAAFREAEANPADQPLPPRTLHIIKDRIHIVGRYADPLIRYEKRRNIVLAIRLYGYLWRRRRALIFDGIVIEILK